MTRTEGVGGPNENIIPPRTTEEVKGPNLNRTGDVQSQEVGQIIADVISNPFANFFKYFQAAKDSLNLSDTDAHKVARLTAKRYGDQIPPEDKGISFNKNA